MGDKLAIDFGTTNTVIARWDTNTGTADIVALPQVSARLPDGLAFVPSLLYVEDGREQTVRVGQTVRAARFDENPGNRLFRNFKRGLVSTVANEQIIDGVPWTDRDAGSHFLQEIIQAIRDQRSEDNPGKAQGIEALVLTAPVTSFDGYVAWLSNTMSLLDAEQIHVVDESTAAALGYGASEPGALALVFDFGGGTLDLSLVQLPESREKAGGLLSILRRETGEAHTARVIAKAGCTLGGSDVDRWLFNSVLAQQHLSPDRLGDDSTALLTECERAKIALSAAETTALNFRAGGQEYSVEVTRTVLETLLEANGMYSALRHSIEKVLHTAQRSGIFKEDVSHVLLV
ncbi:MAG TPA: Hsp70 family protein, partial [Aggregatilineales bacterium]|nr:Hsp70 family protein [Aggregatilineales bacterium]